MDVKAPTVEVSLKMSDNVTQPARFFGSSACGPRPLVVSLHAWSATYQMSFVPKLENYLAENGWHILSPNFRGPSWNYDSCASERAIQDVLESIEWVKQQVSVDKRRIYVIGLSGGGHLTMQLAARHPEVWAGASAWVGISHIGKWHKQCKNRVDENYIFEYSKHIETVCGGEPGSSLEADREVALRSPLTFLKQHPPFPFQISAGIHDGHTGSVPISHSMEAFNAIANPEDSIAQEDIDFMTEREEIPGHLKQHWDAPEFGDKTLLFRKSSGNTTLNIFEGGHEVVESALKDFLISL